MLTILTKPPGFHPFIKEWLYYYIKKFSKRKRGPSSVLQSIIRGLDELNEPYVLNPFFSSQINDMVLVPSGIETLKKTLKLRSEGKIKRLIVGPNITITPIDENSLLLNPNIDKILVPSEWVKNFFLSFDKNLESKIIIWPAGIDIKEKGVDDSKNQYLIFKKNTDEKLFENICEYMRNNSIPFKVLEYGKFTKKEYLAELKKSFAMVYLQEIESQGIALLEAWSMNVPTFVWNPGSFVFKNYNKTVTGNINAPYANEKTGDNFKDIEEFRRKLSTFIKNLNSYSPYEYAKENFRDNITTANLLKLLNI
ncbi:MAG: hypothetical protein Q7R78_03210 [bacterium]|nr:hypothetical protein [bacterium]